MPPPISSLLQVAKRYGVKVVQPNAALPGLALSAARAVALGRASAVGALGTKIVGRCRNVTMLG